MHMLRTMKATINREQALATLRTNRERHASIVQEARAGYIDRAQKAVAAKLDQLRSGKVVALRFDLHLPTDHTKTYDTAIRILELHQGDTIEVDAEQVRNLIQDEWEWSGAFLMDNARYSSTAATMVGSSDEE
jgi:hypothetical protein